MITSGENKQETGTMSNKKKTPAIVLLAIDGIKQGTIPSETTLEAIWDEIDGNQASLQLAQALLEAIGQPRINRNTNNVSKPVQTKSNQSGGSKPSLRANTKPLTPGQVDASRGRVSVISGK